MYAYGNKLASISKGFASQRVGTAIEGSFLEPFDSANYMPTNISFNRNRYKALAGKDVPNSKVNTYELSALPEFDSGFGKVIVGDGILVSSNYKFVYSKDGFMSYSIGLNTGQNTNNGIFANGKFLYTVLNTSALYTSTDGISWTTSTLPLSLGYTAFGYGFGLYILMTTGSTSFLTSPDGVNWTTRTLSVADNLVEMAFSPSTCVSVSGSYPWYSSDGTAFTRGSPFPYASVSGIAYGNGIFVAVGIGGMNTSTDGINWTARTVSGTWTRITFNGTEFMAIGAGIATTSTDGITWATTFIIPNFPYKGIVYHDGRYICTAGENALLFIYRSLNGSSDWVNISGSIDQIVGVS